MAPPAGERSRKGGRGRRDNNIKEVQLNHTREPSKPATCNRDALGWETRSPGGGGGETDVTIVAASGLILPGVGGS